MLKAISSENLQMKIVFLRKTRLLFKIAMKILTYFLSLMRGFLNLIFD